MEKLISNIKNCKYKNFYTQSDYNHYWEFYFNDFIVFKGINCTFCGDYVRLQNLNRKKYPENIYCKCFTNEWINNYKDIHNYYLEKVIKEYMNIIKSRHKIIKYSLFYKKQKKYIIEDDDKENKYIIEDGDKENTLLSISISDLTSDLDSDLTSESSLDLSSLDSNYNSDSELSYDSNNEYDPYNNVNLNIILNSLIENTVEDFFKKL